MKKDLIKRYIAEFRSRDFSEVIDRELRVNFVKNKAISIIGPRRAGKTYFLFSLMKNLENYIYIDFEHPIFYTITPDDIIPIMDAYFELYPEGEPLYIFLDEVQDIQDWERMVRYLLDMGYYVAVTGSSSKLLSKEIATHLRGRSLVYNLFNLSFREFLKFRGIEYSGESLYINFNKIKKSLDEYLKYGAYPDVALSDKTENKERILKDYLNLIITRDIVERYNIRNRFLINELVYFGINNYSRYISYDSLFKLFKQRIKVTKRTLINYLQGFEDAMIFFFLRRYDTSVKARMVSPRKIYLIDTGFGLFGSKDVARDMENVIFIELLRRIGPVTEIFYFKDQQGHEVDFVVKRGDVIEELIQVTYASSFDEVERREWRNLLKAMELLKCRNLLCITWDYEDERELSWFGRKGSVSFVPLWKWLLERQEVVEGNEREYSP